MGFIYLASPYTPHNGESIEERVAKVAKVAADLMEEGYSVFSPIVHSHYIAAHLSDDRRLDHEFWMKQDLPMVSAADSVWVLQLDGWEDSKGVAREIKYANFEGKPIHFITEDWGKLRKEFVVKYGNKDQTAVGRVRW